MAKSPIRFGFYSIIKSKVLYDDYIDFASKIGDKYRMPNSQFGKEIKELCPPVNIKRLKGSGNGIGDNRSWHLLFPSLDECRTMFEKTVKLKIKWED